MTHGDGMTQRAGEIVWPEIFLRLRAFLEAGEGDGGEDRRTLVERALGIAGLTAFLEGRPEPETVRELLYAGHPFEVIPFAWNGGDALVYALLIHDLEAPPAFVSYAPSDDPDGPVWLADDAPSALQHLMAVSLRDVALHAQGEAWAEEARVETAAAVNELSRALDLSVIEPPDDLTEGARSTRFVEFEVPDGWTFEPCNDIVGVLAPTAAFAPELLDPDEDQARPFDEAHELAQANELLARGFPASALAVARNVYLETAYSGSRGVPAARVMQRAYEALGRDFLVRRVDAYVRQSEPSGR